MDRTLLALSTLCFLVSFAHTMYALGARTYQDSKLPLVFNILGFAGQCGFLWIRGQALGRCPLTNSFEVIVFLCWAMVLFYLLIGPAYRLSLMGAFTSPQVLVLQGIGLLLPVAAPRPAVQPPSALMELHAALSVVSYGAFALACVAGIMYLVQERQLKTHHIQSIFYHLPPVQRLAKVNSRLVLIGFVLFTVGLAAGFQHGLGAHVALLQAVAVGIWLLYAGVLVATYWHRISPRWVAVLSISAFAIMLLTLWGIHLVPRAAA